jgi:hypothetical protein
MDSKNLLKNSMYEFHINKETQAYTKPEEVLFDTENFVFAGTQKNPLKETHKIQELNTKADGEEEEVPLRNKNNGVEFAYDKFATTSEDMIEYIDSDSTYAIMTVELDENIRGQRTDVIAYPVRIMGGDIDVEYKSEEEVNLGMKFKTTLFDEGVKAQVYRVIEYLNPILKAKYFTISGNALTINKSAVGLYDKIAYIIYRSNGQVLKRDCVVDKTLNKITIDLSGVTGDFFLAIGRARKIQRIVYKFNVSDFGASTPSTVVVTPSSVQTSVNSNFSLTSNMLSDFAEISGGKLILQNSNGTVANFLANNYGSTSVRVTSQADSTKYTDVPVTIYTAYTMSLAYVSSDATTETHNLVITETGTEASSYTVQAVKDGTLASFDALVGQNVILQKLSIPDNRMVTVLVKDSNNFVMQVLNVTLATA